MPRKPPKVRIMKPALKTADFRTCPPPPRSYASRLADDPGMAFYSSAAWRALRASIIAKRGPTCETCGSVTERPIVDHLTEIRDGGAPLDPDNCAVKCASCHTRKTGQARAARFGLT
jgi:5-methylcytosine-specific restriction protein A